MGIKGKGVLVMSITRIKLIAAVTPEELEDQANDFLKMEEVELKQVDYQTNGYEKPYSIAILYTPLDN